MVNILAFLCLSGAISLFFRRRTEETIPVAIVAWMLVLYALAMVGKLSAIDGISWGILAASGVAAAASKTVRARLQQDWKNLLTPALLVLLLTAVGLWFFTRYRYVLHGDDMQYWAIEVKSLFYCDKFVDSLHHSTIWFGSYMPGMQLLNWQGMHINGVWQEHALFFSQFLIHACFCLPLLKKLRWKHWYLIPVAAVLMIALPTAMTRLCYDFLNVDYTLGVLLGYAMTVAYEAQAKDRYSMLAFGCALCALTLTKAVGMVWAAAALLFALLICRKNCSMRGLLGSVAAVAACFFSWKLFCRANGLQTYLNDITGDALLSLLKGTYQRPSGTGRTTLYTLKAFLAFPTNSNYGSNSIIGLSYGAWMLILCLMQFFAYRSKGDCREHVKIGWFFAITTLLTVTAFSASFFFTFMEEAVRYASDEALLQYLFVRYCLPIQVAAGYLSLHMLLNEPIAAHAIGKRIGALAALTVLCVNYPALGMYMRRVERSDWIAYQAENTDWFVKMSMEERRNTRVLFAYSSTITQTAYALVPATFSGLSNEILANDYSEEAVRAWVDQYGCTHVLFLDEQNASYSYLCRAFGVEAPKLNALYKIDKSEIPYRLILAE